MRTPLVVTSVGVHIAVVAAFFVAGFWKLDRLEPERRRIDITSATLPPPAAASGSPSAARTEAFKPKRTVTKQLVQPVKRDPEVTAKPAVTDDEGTGGTGTGPGAGSGSDPTGTGDCIGDDCGPAVAPPQPAPRVIPPTIETVFVPPLVMKGMRIAGETQVHPPATVKTAIRRDGVTKVVATFKVCVGASGGVTSVSLVKASGYPAYDTTLHAALQGWRYRPYEIGGRRVPVCGVVTFNYSMQ